MIPGRPDVLPAMKFVVFVLVGVTVVFLSHNCAALDDCGQSMISRTVVRSGWRSSGDTRDNGIP